MAKRAQISTEQMYNYPIESVFKVIAESILKQMKGKDHKNNINYKNPLGKESNYFIKKGGKEIPVNFLVTEYEKPYKFAYIITVNNAGTESIWEIEDFSMETTKVTYTEKASNKSIFYYFFKILNKKKFERTAAQYFYLIDAVLEKETTDKAKKENKKVKQTANLDKMTVIELRTLAAEKQLKIPAKAKKADIIALIKKAK